MEMPARSESTEAAPAEPEKTKKEFSLRIPKKKTLLVILALLIIFSISYQVRLNGFHNPDGTPKWPYLRNIDSYSYFADVEKMLEGTGEFTIGNRLYQHTTFWGYKFFVGSDVTMESLTQFLIWWPAFLISLAVIPAYFIGRYLYDRKAGILAAFFVVMAPNIATRSLAGDPDSDVMVILMVLISVALFAVALHKFNPSKAVSKRNIFYSLLAGAGIAFFAFTWPGYWFVFFIMLGTIIIGKFLIAPIVLKLEKRPSSDIKKHLKAWAFHLALILLGFWIVTTPILGPQFILNPFSQVGISTDLFGSGGIKSEQGEFPNVYVSVAELQQGGQVGTIINRAAGVDMGASSTGLDAGLLGLISPFILALFAFAYLIYSYYKRREHLDTLLILGLWFIGMLYSSTVAVRFGIFLAPVIAITAAIGLSKLWNLTFQQEKVEE